MSKAEIINNMINNYNNEVIDTLIKFSPQFIDEIKQSRSISNNSTNEISQNSQSEVQKTLSDLTNSIDKKIEEVNSQNDYNQMMSNLELRERKEPMPAGPKTPSASTYVGATNEDVEKLIKSNEYYSLLHGINRESFMQYNSFIQTGFNLITSDYYNRAASCNTLEERLNALQELKEIYDNFNGYITMEQSNQLRETIENMSKYLQKEQSQQMIDDIGIRYNGENFREVNSGRRM